MDPDEQPEPAPAQPQAAGQPAEENGSPSDAAPAEHPGDEAGDSTGAAPTPDEPGASDDYGHDPARVGDFTDPDVDLDHLTPADDGDPDDDADPIETVSQVATGQALIMPFSDVQAEAGTDRPGDDGARMDGR